MPENNPPISRVPRSKEEAKAAYDKLSPWYDALAGSSERKYTHKGLRELSVKEGETVLEIGFGTGHSLVTLGQTVGEHGTVYGVDISEGMLNVARSRLKKAGLADRVELRQADAAQLPFEDGLFDAVFMSFTLELFDTAEIADVLGECHRVLRSGGRLGLVALSKRENDRLMVRLYEWAHRQIPKYIDCRPIYVQKAVEQAGFHILEAREMSMWGLPVDVVIAKKGGKMTNSEHYDALIIGAGQSGVPLSTALSGAGWKTALVEEQHVGGTCVNEGCTPTKTMVASARVAYIARRAADYGVQNSSVSVDMVKVRQRKRDIVKNSRQKNRQRVLDADVDLLMGRAAFVGPKTVEVHLNNDGGTRQLSADKILINTGARPRVPDLHGIENVPYLNSTTIMELEVVPEHLLVIGGGYVGVEFAQMFRRFGSQVTLIQRGDQLLTREDSDVAEEVAQILRQDGIEVLLDSRPDWVEQISKRRLELSLETPAGRRTVSGSHLLIAAGRVPNTEQLNLSAAGVQVDDGNYIEVNEHLETNVPGIYAMGDVKGGPAFTHISYDDFRILRTNLLRDGEASISGRMVPYVVFIDPELAHVGLSEEQARNQGLNIQVAKIPMNYVARALEMNETRGFMKAIVDADTSQILGCAILGVQGGEIMAILQTAMMGQLPYTALRDGIFTHPTLAESLNNLFATIDG
jgi:pyruvate/2-oxoglutarate dehydrogenase complex dihydrolipoamide dehydrogenase (E3) component/ubiquinone/menaquinone biosynthesis C-methylase UbiE